MSVVNLVSGGLDSTLIGVLAHEEGIATYPLFVDYGQRAAEIEWKVCCTVHKRLELPDPIRLDVSGYGALIRSGLTCHDMDVTNQAFTPGRNMMFLLMGASYAYQVGASAVSIGLLSEQHSLFPDQRIDFIRDAEIALKAALGRHISIITPLSEFTKADVIHLAQEKGIDGTYSCHAGAITPCGVCISCMEFVIDTTTSSGGQHG